MFNASELQQIKFALKRHIKKEKDFNPKRKGSLLYREPTDKEKKDLKTSWNIFIWEMKELANIYAKAHFGMELLSKYYNT